MPPSAVARTAAHFVGPIIRGFLSWRTVASIRKDQENLLSRSALHYCHRANARPASCGSLRLRDSQAYLIRFWAHFSEQSRNFVIELQLPQEAFRGKAIAQRSPIIVEQNKLLKTRVEVRDSVSWCCGRLRCLMKAKESR
jgi:hypothetical protein